MVLSRTAPEKRPTIQSDREDSDIAPSSVLVAFRLFAANPRKIDEFSARAAKGRRRSDTCARAARPNRSVTGHLVERRSI